MQTEDGEGSVNAAPQNNGQEQATQQPDANASWKFEPNDTAPVEASNPAPALPHSEPVSWTASEYIAHHKSVLWFAGLGLVIAVLTLGVYLLTKEVLTAATILIIGLCFGIFGARQPRVLQYVLDERGLHISGKLYPYDRLKSFATLQEGPIRSIQLMPMQRFMPPLSVYYDPTDETKILNVIGNYIPHEEREHDIVDKLMSKIRF